MERKTLINRTLLILGALILVWLLLFFYMNAWGSIALFRTPPQNLQEEVANGNAAQFLKIPEGFELSIFAEDLNDARVLSYDPSGAILVSVPSEGRILALLDRDHDGFSEGRSVVVEGLSFPHGMEWDCRTDECKFYVGAEDGVYAFDYQKESHKAINGKKILDLPRGEHHNRRSLRFMPYPNDDTLLVSVGSSCNVCHEEDPRQAKVMQINVKTGESKEYARGLRNAPFLAIHPVDGNIWVTEMGRDFLGDNLPPDEINILKEEGNYGWPNCYGKNIHDGDFDKNTYIRNPCMEPFELPSHINIPAHSAPLGLAFIPEEGWPESYWYDLLVAYHGSWNRTTPTGYKIVRYNLDEKGNYIGEEDFISGWLTEDKKFVYGRPVDIIVQPGGTMYISDDKTGVVYELNRK